MKKPVIAIAELIWNGLDADATEVRIGFQVDFAGNLAQIVVQDNGAGMPYDQARLSFGSLGGSWKRDQRRSHDSRRLLHGRAGRGRFRAFALGNVVQWVTTYRNANTGALETYSVSGSLDRLGEFALSQPRTGEHSDTGTRVEITEINKNFPSLRGPLAEQDIGEEFAIYLRKYPEINLRYDGAIIDPSSLEAYVKEYALSPSLDGRGRPHPATLEIVEWKMAADRHLYLCDEDGFPLHRTTPGIQAPGYAFTAYLKSSHIRELDENALLDLEEPTTELVPLLEAARRVLRGHFRARGAAAARELVEEWKRTKIYPYEGQPSSPVEEVRRQVFDVIALNVNEYLPDFAAAPTQAKRFSLRLLQEALDESPETVQRIVTEVLDLPPDKVAQLAELLQSTTLSSVISASKLVGDRVTFLEALAYMVFDPEGRKVIKERRHLHKILENETWVFGEEFNLSATDKGLSTVLKRHLELLGHEACVDGPVTRLDGTTGIVDLMLSRTIPQPRADQHEHLIIELKRPKVAVDSKVLQQIKDYAYACVEDARFKDTNTKWHFIAVATEVAPDVRREASQRNRQPGLVVDGDGYQIWVKTWSQILDSARARLRFFKDSLEFDASEEEARSYLTRVYAKYLPDDLTKATGDIVGRG